jgi:predicted GNAT family acetyltransferase
MKVVVSMNDLLVRQDVRRGRYQIYVDGAVGGLTQYVERGNERIFVHTETEPGFEGKGLASELIRQALEGTRSQGMRIIPVCPFVAAYVSRHHDFDDIVDRVQPHHPQPV